MKAETIGWILVHSKDEYGEGKEFSTPMDELEDYYEPGKVKPWHWRYPKPPREGGPYTILFAWDGKVFGDGQATITHEIQKNDYNFAFDVRDYKKHKPVAFADLPLGNRLHNYRSLIRLDADILAAYQKLK